jgi:hypothetical protein
MPIIAIGCTPSIPSPAGHGAGACAAPVGRHMICVKLLSGSVLQVQKLAGGVGPHCAIVASAVPQSRPIRPTTSKVLQRPALNVVFILPPSLCAGTIPVLLCWRARNARTAARSWVVALPHCKYPITFWHLYYVPSDLPPHLSPVSGEAPTPDASIPPHIGGAPRIRGWQTGTVYACDLVSSASTSPSLPIARVQRP